MRDQSFELQTNTFTNSSYTSRSQRSRPKMGKNSNAEFKLTRFNSQSKLDKRRSGGERLNEQIEVQRMFRLHARSRISEQQALFSLKLLGFQCKTAEQYSRFHKIWSNYAPAIEEQGFKLDEQGLKLDEQGFKLLVIEVKSKGEMLDQSQAFNILTQGRMTLDGKRLALIGEQLDRDMTGILQFCGKEGLIDYSQFDMIMKFSNALS